MLNDFFNLIFKPVLGLNPLLFVIIISLLLTALVTLIYKLFTNQKLLKEIKNEMNLMKEELKKLRDSPEKAMQLNQKLWSKNLEYMKHSMKPTLITFIPVILLFSWLNSFMAFEPIRPDQEFIATLNFKEDYQGNVTVLLPDKVKAIDQDQEVKQIENGKVSWNLIGKEGKHILAFKYNDQEFQKDILITNEQKYENPIKTIKGSSLEQIEVNNKKLTILNLFGFRLGWLGAYIILSIIFSLVIRKIFNIS